MSEQLSISDVLQEAGLRPAQARILAFLSTVKEADRVEICAGAGVRQPQVSLHTRRFPKWIAVREVPCEGSRPKHIYSLSKPLSEIAAVLIHQIEEATAKRVARIHRTLGE